MSVSLYQIQSQSEVLGVRTSTHTFGGNKIQPIILAKIKCASKPKVLTNLCEFCDLSVLNMAPCVSLRMESSCVSDCVHVCVSVCFISLRKGALAE